VPLKNYVGRADVYYPSIVGGALGSIPYSRNEVTQSSP